MRTDKISSKWNNQNWKHVPAFHYIDKLLIVLSATSSGVCIILFPSVFRAPAGIIKTLLIIARNKKKKHDKILVLAKSKLDSIETLVSQALTDMEISHEEFNAIIREKKIWQDERECEEC